MEVVYERAVSLKQTDATVSMPWKVFVRTLRKNEGFAVTTMYKPGHQRTSNFVQCNSAINFAKAQAEAYKQKLIGMTSDERVVDSETTRTQNCFDAAPLQKDESQVYTILLCYCYVQIDKPEVLANWIEGKLYSSL